MGNLAVINMIGLTPHAYESVFGGPSSLKRVIKWAENTPDYQGIIFLKDSELKLIEVEEGYSEVIQRDSWTETEFIDALLEGLSRSREKNPEALFHIWGDCPLVDIELTKTLWELHYKYDAEYTFADGYPHGLAPEILSPGLLTRLKPLAVQRSCNLERNSIFEILKKDINAFDIETHLSPIDLRMERVSISCDTVRNRNIAEDLYAAGGIDAETLCRVIPENRHLLRNLPSYFPIQITNYCPQSCSYCPFPQFSGNPMEGRDFMDLSKFSDLCRRIHEFADDAVIVPSLWGEPASHPQIGEMIRHALSLSSTIRVLIETSGIGWDRSLLADLAGEFNAGRLMWIVSLDTADEGLYHTLRGDGMHEAEKMAETLAELFGRHCWMQAVRMNENEEALEDFHHKWKDVGGGVIIQKHDSYSGYLENRQPADLSPLDRFPCWHLKRDMPILIDGTVPICRTDLGRRENSGNAFEEDLELIWSRGMKLYQAHVEKKYPGPCENCDEFYTFNF